MTHHGDRARNGECTGENSCTLGKIADSWGFEMKTTRWVRGNGLASVVAAAEVKENLHDTYV